MKHWSGENPWCIEEREVLLEKLPERESIFTVGNGYLGFRGNLEEPGKAASIPGSYLSGLFDCEPIHYGEAAYGYAENNETMCRVAEGKGLSLFADGEALAVGVSKLNEHRRCLHMNSGLLTRTVRWKTTSGCELLVEFVRFACLRRKHIAAVHCTVTALHGSCTLTAVSGIEQMTPPQDGRAGDPRMAQSTGAMHLHQRGAETDSRYFTVEHTSHTHQAAVCMVEHQPSPRFHWASVEKRQQGVFGTWSTALRQGQSVEFTKYLSYTAGEASKETSLLQTAKAELSAAAAAGYGALRQEQLTELRKFWDSVGIAIEGDDALLQGLRFNLYQLLQSCSRDGGNIAAKGLTGQGYEGHYFWDTEAYIFPFFLYTHPETARQLLLSRYGMLEKARARARVMGHAKGALFPWRTISGEECSAYYPAGTAQYHISADIAYAVDSYLKLTKDMAFLAQYGAELLAETARLWVSLGFFCEAKGGAFCIHTVTGPDEYNVLVDNNVYTNLMARHNLLAAADAVEELWKESPADYERLKEAIGLLEEEPGQWRKAARRMYLPFDESTALIPQDDGFFTRKPWPLSTIPKENFPLLLHYHPLVIYRHQVCKQADLILAMVMEGKAFTKEQKRENYYFYDRITTHDSSLSRAVFGILASEIGEQETAAAQFQATVRLDLDNMHENTRDGLHMANMAGAWLSLVMGFGGLRQEDGELCLTPRLPAAWRSFAFRLCVRGRTLAVMADSAEIKVTLLCGGPLGIRLCGEPRRLECGKTVTMKQQEEKREIQ